MKNSIFLTLMFLTILFTQSCKDDDDNGLGGDFPLGSFEVKIDGKLFVAHDLEDASIDEDISGLNFITIAAKNEPTASQVGTVGLYLPPKIRPGVTIKITKFNKLLEDEKTKKKIYKRVQTKSDTG